MNGVSIRTIKVNNCQACPFCNKDNEFGCDSCNLEPEIYAKPYSELPCDGRHSECPLTTDCYLITKEDIE